MKDVVVSRLSKVSKGGRAADLRGPAFRAESSPLFTWALITGHH